MSIDCKTSTDFENGANSDRPFLPQAVLWFITYTLYAGRIPKTFGNFCFFFNKFSGDRLIRVCFRSFIRILNGRHQGSTTMGENVKLLEKVAFGEKNPHQLQFMQVSLQRMTLIQCKYTQPGFTQPY